MKKRISLIGLALFSTCLFAQTAEREPNQTTQTLPVQTKEAQNIDPAQNIQTTTPPEKPVSPIKKFFQNTPPKEATASTKKANQAVLSELPFNDTQDFEDARTGFVASLADLTINGPSGTPVWKMSDYDFLKKTEVPATVNPSLWRIAQLNINHGLYKVVDRVYQIRGFDLSNMTILEGYTGLILIDPLISLETAKAGLELYYQNRPKKPVVAVIYSHSHVDHYGGVKGVISEEEVKAGKVQILAPEHFLEEAVSENVFAGNAMSRRAMYMYGAFLPKSEKGQVDGGLGKTASSGTVTLIPPSDTIKATGEKRRIDGVDIVFQMAPGTEAPAEMLMYFPQFKTLCAAEDVTHTLHNLYTLRGAQVRNAKNWWKAINDAIELFGGDAQVIIAQHHWPKWGNANVISFMKKQRDVYKYIHDQSLRLANLGFTMTEIAEQIQLPKSIGNEWFNRGYYGSVNHDSKAVYQRYLGWYDSNPAHLHLLPPEEAAKKYVEFMGGEKAILSKAKKDFDKGNYRWVVEVVNQVVFANPKNKEARELQADALEQLGYQAENATWRNEYLMGAYELRNGVIKVDFTTESPDTIKAMTLDMFLDFMGIRLNGEKAEGKVITLNWLLPDTNEKFAVTLENGVLAYTLNKEIEDAQITITAPRTILNEIMLGKTTLEDAVKAGKAKTTGNVDKFKELTSLLDTFNPMFNIVTP